jgi:hypothetical protein
MTKNTTPYHFQCLSPATVNQMIREGVDPEIIARGVDPESLLGALIVAAQANDVKPEPASEN